MMIKGNFTVNGKEFFDFFNDDINKKYRALFPKKIKQRSSFLKFVNNIEALTGSKSITLNEFLGYFLIVYNETGASFRSLSEMGNDAYFFEDRDMGHWRKASYNGNYNKKAGDQLYKMGVISSASDVAIWNNQTQYPHSQPSHIKKIARECDFFKYRGRGLNQITWRSNYKKFVEPLLKKYKNKSLENVTNSDLDKAFEDPKIYLGSFKNYYLSNIQADAINQLKAGNVAMFVTRTAGNRSSYVSLFQRRFDTLSSELSHSTLKSDEKKKPLS